MARSAVFQTAGEGSIPSWGTTPIIPGSSNGRTRVFESRYGGSNPPPGTPVTASGQPSRFHIRVVPASASAPLVIVRSTRFPGKEESRVRIPGGALTAPVAE